MEKSEKHSFNYKRLIGVILSIIAVLYIILVAFSIYTASSMKKSKDQNSKFFGKQMRIVHSTSMEKNENTNTSNFRIKNIKENSLIFVSTVPSEKEDKREFYSNIEIGDVLAYKYVIDDDQLVYVNRVVKTEKVGSDYRFTLEADNKGENDKVEKYFIDTSMNSENYIIGKVTYKNHFLGLFVNSFNTTSGIVSFIIIPCAIVVLYEALIIANEIIQSRKNKFKELESDKEAEMEELNKKLNKTEETNESFDEVKNSDEEILIVDEESNDDTEENK